MDKTKPFGLIIPKKKDKYQPNKKSVFASDSDDESNSVTHKSSKQVNIPLKKSGSKVEDNTAIYEYDNIYDEMKREQSKKEIAAKSKAGPCYINSLLKAAEKRKKDHERRVEKKIQIERAKEGDQFKDKEAFVTSAYKEKMRAMQEEEEKERLKSQMEDMMDVTKQNDLTGFYKHYLKQAVGEESVPDFGASNIEIQISSIKQEVLSDSESRNETTSPGQELRSDKKSNAQKLDEPGVNLKGLDDDTSSNSSEQSDANSSSDSSENGGNIDSTKEISSVHISRKASKRKDKDAETYNENSKKLIKCDQGAKQSEVPPCDISSIDRNLNSDKESSEVRKKSNISSKFEKRTVGEVFDHAQARYFERVAARSARNV